VRTINQFAWTSQPNAGRAFIPHINNSLKQSPPRPLEF